MIAEKQNILGFNVSIKEAIKAIYLLIKHCNQDEIGTPEKNTTFQRYLEELMAQSFRNMNQIDIRSFPKILILFLSM